MCIGTGEVGTCWNARWALWGTRADIVVTGSRLGLGSSSAFISCTECGIALGKSSANPRSEFSVAAPSLGDVCCQTDLMKSASGNIGFEACHGVSTLTGGVNKTELLGVGDCVV
jgi:hypothetical protein